LANNANAPATPSLCAIEWADVSLAGGNPLWFRDLEHLVVFAAFAVYLESHGRAFIGFRYGILVNAHGCHSGSYVSGVPLDVNRLANGQTIQRQVNSDNADFVEEVPYRAYFMFCHVRPFLCPIFLQTFRRKYYA
jgi:organic radical activating enzyme